LKPAPKEAESSFRPAVCLRSTLRGSHGPDYTRVGMHRQRETVLRGACEPRDVRDFSTATLRRRYTGWQSGPSGLIPLKLSDVAGRIRPLRHCRSVASANRIDGVARPRPRRTAAVPECSFDPRGSSGIVSTPESGQVIARTDDGGAPAGRSSTRFRRRFLVWGGLACIMVSRYFSDRRMGHGQCDL